MVPTNGTSQRSRLKSTVVLAFLVGANAFLWFWQKIRMVKSVSSFEPIHKTLKGDGHNHTFSSGDYSSNWPNFSSPRWRIDGGIPIDSLLEYTSGVLDTTIEGHHLPTSVYIVDGNWSIWTSRRLQRKHKRLVKRIRPSEWLAVKALTFLQESMALNMSHSWSSLERAMGNGGFPFLTYYKDFNGCNLNNWKRNHSKLSIPIFTLSARMDCDFVFPWPTYESITLAKSDAYVWRESMISNRKMFAKKKPMAVWRGSLTGTNNKALDESIRWRLCELAANHSTIIDARLVQTPDWRTDVDLSKVGGLAPKMSMGKFQSYAAVIDVDGNAWSSRFAALLCMDSVVLKVQPTMVDHLFEQLDPWTHYIPVSDSLTDLIPKIEWILAHPDQVARIVDNAHAWCTQRMVVESLVRDTLTIWNTYVQQLDIASTHWSDTWERKLPGLFRSTYEMTKISF